MSWQLILAWVLYLAVAFGLSYRKATTFNLYSPLLDKTDWVFFGIYMTWYICIGVIVTSMII